jgi:hypothetical protein
MRREGERSVAGLSIISGYIRRTRDTLIPERLTETLWSSCYGCPNGTSNDWTRGSLTFISGHYAQDVVEGNRSLLERVSCVSPPSSVVRSKLCR